MAMGFVAGGLQLCGQEKVVNTTAGDGELKSTTRLLHEYQEGREGAREELMARYLPVLRRWAHGRLPRRGRDLAETDDLVQITFLRALKALERFDAERPGAFLAYLRTILLNCVREELRRSKRTPPSAGPADALADQGSVLEQAVGAELLEDYESALETLSEGDRNAVILRLEFGMTFPEIALELDSPSANAARMSVSRALRKVAEAMQR